MSNSFTPLPIENGAPVQSANDGNMPAAQALPQSLPNGVPTQQPAPTNACTTPYPQHQVGQPQVRQQVGRGKPVRGSQPPPTGQTQVLKGGQGQNVGAGRGVRPTGPAQMTSCQQPMNAGQAIRQQVAQQNGGNRLMQGGPQVRPANGNRPTNLMAAQAFPRPGQRPVRPQSPALRPQGGAQLPAGVINQQLRQPSPSGSQPMIRAAGGNQQPHPASKPGQQVIQQSPRPLLTQQASRQPVSSTQQPARLSSPNPGQQGWQPSQSSGQLPQQATGSQPVYSSSSTSGLMAPPYSGSPAAQAMPRPNQQGPQFVARPGTPASMLNPHQGMSYPPPSPGVPAQMQPRGPQAGGPRSGQQTAVHNGQVVGQSSQRVVHYPASPHSGGQAQQMTATFSQPSPKNGMYIKASPRQSQPSPRNRKASVQQSPQQSTPPPLQLPPPQQRLQGRQQQSSLQQQGGPVSNAGIRQQQQQLPRTPQQGLQPRPSVQQQGLKQQKQASISVPMSSPSLVQPAGAAMAQQGQLQRSGSGQLKRGPSPTPLQKTLSAPQQFAGMQQKGASPTSQKGPPAKLQKTMSGPVQKTVPGKVKQEVKLKVEGNAQGTGKDKVKDGAGDKSSSPGRKISCEDIQLVQNLIERCLQLYMNQKEVITTLQYQAKIEPGFTSLVWQKLEEQNPDFFKAYYVRLKVKDQIMLFNHLLEQHVHLMQKMRSQQQQAFPKPVTGPVPNQAAQTSLPQILPRPRPGEVPVQAMPPPPHFPAMPMQRPPGGGAIAVPAQQMQPLAHPPPYANGVPLGMAPMAPPSHQQPSPGRYPVRPGLESMPLGAPGPPSSTPPGDTSAPLGMPPVSTAEPFPFPAEVAPAPDMPMENAFPADHHSTPPHDHGGDGTGGGLCATDPEDALKHTESLGSLGHLPRNFSLSDLTAELNNPMDQGGLLGDSGGLLGLGDPLSLGGLGLASPPHHSLAADTEAFLRSPHRHLDDDALLGIVEPLDFDKLK